MQHLALALSVAAFTTTALVVTALGLALRRLNNALDRRHRGQEGDAQ